MRARVVADGIRMDGRGLNDVRELEIDTGVIPRAHGSGLFRRGETQVLNVTTLGMLRMEQMLDTISIEDSKRYMHHYNFRPSPRGRPVHARPQAARDRHGALAEKAVLPVIPNADEFPYAFRLVSEVLASNGSSSMASSADRASPSWTPGCPSRRPWPVSRWV